MTDFVFVLVTKSTIDVGVAGLESVGDGGRDLTGRGLPCTETDLWVGERRIKVRKEEMSEGSGWWV